MQEYRPLTPKLYAQDQCGGLYPGFKWSQSDRHLPLRVRTEVLSVSPEASARLASHLVLVYTGKARLAKTLLYDVLRRWHMRVPQVVDNLSALQATAEVTPSRQNPPSLAQLTP
jgi:fucokinase